MFVHGIHLRSRFIHEQDGGPGQESSGDGHPLAFPAGQQDTVVTDFGIQAGGHPREQIRQARGADGPFEIFLGRVGCGILDVVAEGAL